jgi:hypothetical protein
MLSRIKQYALIAILIIGFYYILSHHFIFTSWTSFHVLPKQELTLKYTFFSLKQAIPESVLKNETLRDAGIGQIMLDEGMLSEQRYDAILRKIDYE